MFRVKSAINTKSAINFILLQENPVTDAVYDIKPSTSRTVVKFSEPIQTNSSITFNIDLSQSLLGNELVLIIENGQTATITLNTPLPMFVWTCGGITDSLDIEGNSEGNPSRLVLYLMFDGSYWTYTGDNC